jgi:ketosteroid isomerase-like protein
MFKRRMGRVLRAIPYLLAGILLISSTGRIEAQGSEAEQSLWNLEHQYWRYVEGNDLQGYLGLWHKDFLGWPSTSAAPVSKDHITDWITSQTSKGLTLKTLDFKPAAIQVTGDIAVTCYWTTFKWSDKDGNGATRTIRVTHTWLRDGKDWVIIGGMSMAETTALMSNAKR